MRLPIFHYGHPILRLKAAPVTQFTDEIHQFIQDMLETRQAHNALGLAAPQVGKSLAIFVASMVEEDAQGKFTESGVRVFINPKLSHPSAERWCHEEGCLSIPGLYVAVERPYTIHVSAMDEKGQHFEEEFSHWHARVIMHENDHLNGVLDIDRIDPKERRLIEPLLRKIKQKYTQ